MNDVVSRYVLALQLKVLSGVSSSGLLQPLIINTTDLVRFGRNLIYILSPLASELPSGEYLHEVNISIFIAQ